MNKLLQPYVAPCTNVIYTNGYKQEGYDEILSYNEWCEEYKESNKSAYTHRVNAINLDHNKKLEIIILQDFLNDAINNKATHFKIWADHADEYDISNIELSTSSTDVYEISEQDKNFHYYRYEEKIETSNMFQWKQ